jgi:hypothetical protein
VWQQVAWRNGGRKRCSPRRESGSVRDSFQNLPRCSTGDAKQRTRYGNLQGWPVDTCSFPASVRIELRPAAVATSVSPSLPLTLHRSQRPPFCLECDGRALPVEEATSRPAVLIASPPLPRALYIVRLQRHAVEVETHACPPSRLHIQPCRLDVAGIAQRRFPHSAQPPRRDKSRWLPNRPSRLPLANVDGAPPPPSSRPTSTSASSPILQTNAPDQEAPAAFRAAPWATPSPLYPAPQAWTCRDHPRPAPAGGRVPA